MFFFKKREFGVAEPRTRFQQVFFNSFFRLRMYTRIHANVLLLLLWRGDRRDSVESPSMRSPTKQNS